MKILTALDLGEYAEIVLEHALDRAASEPEAELHFVTVIGTDDDALGTHRWLDRTVREGLDEFALTGRTYSLHVVRGEPLDVIAVLVAELAADLLVIGRFHVPSLSDDFSEVIASPTLIVGIDGVITEAQCPLCRLVRHASEGERLFCVHHAGDRVPDLVTRLPPGPLVYRGGIW